MKKIFLYGIILVIIPILITQIKQTKTETKFNYEKNINVRLKRVKENKIENINLEKYLIGVLAGEMPVNYELEALKAQAVAARTYTLKHLQKNKQEFDLVDTVDNQVYLDDNYLKETWKNNYEKNIKKIKQAIKETEGEYLTYNGEIIEAFFFSTSSGNTENCKDVFGTDLPYLVSVSSTWDESSPSYNDTKKFSFKEFYEKLNLEYNNTLNIDITRNNTNSINTIIINGNKIKGTDFRHKLGLKSTNIEINYDNEYVYIKSKGYGHGVGMSQYGALELAKQGYKYDEILKHYYQGTEITKN